ncbi:MAG: T9SS type A sorting domain-containing protein, partial [Flavobacteriales bacterium]
STAQFILEYDGSLTAVASTLQPAVDGMRIHHARTNSSGQLAYAATRPGQSLLGLGSVSQGLGSCYEGAAPLSMATGVFSLETSVLNSSPAQPFLSGYELTFPNTSFITSIVCRNEVIEPSTVDAFSAYPTPASETITIEQASISSATLTITDAMGREVYTSPFSARAEVDVRVWPPGVYILQLVETISATNQIAVFMVVR